LLFKVLLNIKKPVTQKGDKKREAIWNILSILSIIENSGSKATIRPIKGVTERKIYSS